MYHHRHLRHVVEFPWNPVNLRRMAMQPASYYTKNWPNNPPEHRMGVHWTTRWLVVAWYRPQQPPEVVGCCYCHKYLQKNPNQVVKHLSLQKSFDSNPITLQGCCVGCVVGRVRPGGAWIWWFWWSWSASLCQRFLGWQEIIFLIIASIKLTQRFFLGACPSTGSPLSSNARIEKLCISLVCVVILLTVWWYNFKDLGDTI
jgi:hypothetical protein